MEKKTHSGPENLLCFFCYQKGNNIPFSLLGSDCRRRIFLIR